MRTMAIWMLALLGLLPLGVGATDNVLGPGDVIKVAVFGNPDLGMEVRIAETGTVNYPLLGEVALAGLPIIEAEKKIAGLLRSGGFVKDPQVNIMLRTLQSRQISLLGQVNRPGRYPLDGVETLTDVLALAGGPAADSSDVVTLLRKEGGRTMRYTLNLFDMVRSGDTARNPRLMHDDIVYIERAPRCYVFGEVQRPGPYRLEREMTVLQALSAGGGLSPRGTTRGLAIRRRMSDGSMQMLKAKLDDLLQPDDVVYVKESLF